MKIIDFELYQDEEGDDKDNIVKLFLGDDDLKSWWGDAWEKIPYEHNAGQVHSNYVSEVVDLTDGNNATFFFLTDHMETNTHYCKEHMLVRAIPFMVVVPRTCNHAFLKGYQACTFLDAIGLECSIKVYFGDMFPFPSVIFAGDWHIIG